MHKFVKNWLKEITISMAIFATLSVETVSANEEPVQDYISDSFACMVDSAEGNTEVSQINSYVKDICKLYPDVDETLVKAVIWHESGYTVDAVNYDGTCVGLMQVSPYWNADRAKRLGVTDFYDPYSNILIGVDCLNEFLQDYDTEMALMLYTLEHDKAYKYYKTGYTPSFVTDIFDLISYIESGGKFYV